MGALLLFLFGAMAVSFLCSVLEAVLMSTPISYITMREEEGYAPAKRMKKYKQDSSRPIAAILSLNTIANTIGAAGVGRQATLVFGSEWFGLVSAITTILILIFSLTAILFASFVLLGAGESLLHQELSTSPGYRFPEEKHISRRYCLQ